eukprot:6146948-Pleurochrysis_carterae.AAC.4
MFLDEVRFSWHSAMCADTRKLGGCCCSGAKARVRRFDKMSRFTKMSRTVSGRDSPPTVLPVPTVSRESCVFLGSETFLLLTTTYRLAQPFP